MIGNYEKLIKQYYMKILFWKLIDLLRNKHDWLLWQALYGEISSFLWFYHPKLEEYSKQDSFWTKESKFEFDSFVFPKYITKKFDPQYWHCIDNEYFKLRIKIINYKIKWFTTVERTKNDKKFILRTIFLLNSH
jgi:hypothetical protein